MAQNPARACPDCDWRALGDFCAGRTTRSYHRGRGTRTYLQTGGSAALPRARRGDHARPDGECRRRAWFGHAFDGKFLQLQARQVHAARTARTRGRPEAALRPRRGYASGEAGRQRPAAVFATTQGSHHAAARTRRADDFIFEPARVFHFIAMPEVWLRCPVSELQRVAYLPSHRAKTFLPHLRSQRKSSVRSE